MNLLYNIFLQYGLHTVMSHTSKLILRIKYLLMKEWWLNYALLYRKKLRVKDKILRNARKWLTQYDLNLDSLKNSMLLSLQKLIMTLSILIIEDSEIRVLKMCLIWLRILISRQLYSWISRINIFWTKTQLIFGFMNTENFLCLPLFSRILFQALEFSKSGKLIKLQTL